MSTQTDRGWVAGILGVAAGDLPPEGTIGSFDGATAWLNSAPLTPASLRGHVVVVQFWTYTCINWLRTQAYFRAWGQRYRDHGLITIGVHTPEFKFEHDLDNVRWAVEARKIDYPVAIDNDFAVWENLGSPESYLGYDQATGFDAGGRAVWDKPHTYTAPEPLRLNRWGLMGDWTVRSDASALNGTNGRVAYQFHARDVNLVMGPARKGASVRFRVLLDGESAAAAHGADVDADGNGTVVQQRMYQLIRQPGPILDRRFEIEFLDSGAEVFCFTFG